MVIPPSIYGVHDHPHSLPWNQWKIRNSPMLHGCSPPFQAIPTPLGNAGSAKWKVGTPAWSKSSMLKKTTCGWKSTDGLFKIHWSWRSFHEFPWWFRNNSRDDVLKLRTEKNTVSFWVLETTNINKHPNMQVIHSDPKISLDLCLSTGQQKHNIKLYWVGYLGVWLSWTHWFSF